MNGFRPRFCPASLTEMAVGAPAAHRVPPSTKHQQSSLAECRAEMGILGNTAQAPPAEPGHKDLPALTASAAEGEVSWATAAQGIISSQPCTGAMGLERLSGHRVHSQRALCEIPFTHNVLPTGGIHGRAHCDRLSDVLCHAEREGNVADLTCNFPPLSKRVPRSVRSTHVCWYDTDTLGASCGQLSLLLADYTATPTGERGGLELKFSLCLGEETAGGQREEYWGATL